MKIYEKNIKALSHVDENLTKLLKTMSENNFFEVYLAENDALANANILNNNSKNVMYENEPLKYINDELEKFEQFNNYPILYFFGIGNGAFYKKILENEKHQRINVYEPELELIYITLNLYDFSEDIMSTRFVLKLAKTVDKQYFIASFNNRTKYFLRTYDFHIHAPFYNTYKEEIDRINKDIISALKFRMYVLGNDLEDTLTGLKYSLKNIPKMIHTPTLQSLVKSKNAKSAIIVSTGPSLTKQLKLLKSIQNYVTILCVDASFPILAKEGIKPDFVFAMERGPLTAKFFKDTPKEFHKDVLFMLATVCHDDVIENIHGQICFYMRPDTYNREFELNEWGYLGGGQSTAHFAYNFAMKAKYDNLIFIGQDLSYGKNGLSHADNHLYGVDVIPTKDIVEEIEAYGGDGTVSTTIVWRAFLNSFVELVAASLCRVINATEGGARIKGTEEISFKTVCEEIIDTSLEKENIKAIPPSKKLVSDSLEQFENKKKFIIGLGEEMFLSIEELYKEVDSYLYNLYKDDTSVLLEKVSLSDLEELVSKIDKMKNFFNRPEFMNVFSGLFLGYAMNHEYDVAVVFVMRDTSEDEKKEKSLEWIKVHHEWLLRVGVTLEKILIAYKA